jgi:hypothetical protein
MQRSIRKLMLLCTALLFCLPAATAPSHATAAALNQQQSATTRPSALSQVAHLDASVHAVGVSGTLAYAVVDSSLQVIDISNPAQPARLTSIDLHDHGIVSLQIAGDRVYLTSGQGVLRIVDIRNPQQPALLSTHNLGLFQLRVVGNLAYGIVQDGSLRVFDVGNPLDVQLRGSYAPTPYFYATDLQVVSGMAYVTTFYTGFQIVDLRDLNRPRLLSQLPYRYDRISINGSRASAQAARQLANQHATRASGCQRPGLCTRRRRTLPDRRQPSSSAAAGWHVYVGYFSFAVSNNHHRRR